MVPMYYITLEYLRNKNIILTRYKIKLYITSSMKKKSFGTYQFYIQTLG